MPVVSGYISDWKEWDANAIPANMLDILNYAFATIVAGEVVMPPQNRSQELLKVRERNNRLKLMLSIGGWGAGGFSEAAATAQGRELFAKSAVAKMREACFDGLDIDWEYPGISAAGITSSPQDKENFTLLICALRNELSKWEQSQKYMLTIAVGASDEALSKIEFERIQLSLDYINVMTYDMRGYESVTGHHTNLCSAIFDKNDQSADLSVRHLVNRGVERSKIVIGAAFYGHTWVNVPNIGTGLRVMGATPGGTLPYSDIVKYIDTPEFIRHFDEYCKAPYLFDGSTFISYDDPESLGYKARYADGMGLGGVMFWEYSQDTDARTLLSALSEAIRKGCR